MPANQNPAAYADCERVFGEAVKAEAGVKLEFGKSTLDNVKAKNFRHRLNTYRVILRKESRKVFINPDDPKHGRSAYDHLVLRVTHEDEIWCLRIEPEPPLDAKLVVL